MLKITAANKGEKIIFTPQEQETLRNAGAAAKKFDGWAAIFSPKMQATFATQINNAKGIQLMAAKYAPSQAEEMAKKIAKVSHWEVNTNKVSPTNMGQLAKTYPNLGVCTAKDDDGVCHRIELICHIENYMEDKEYYDLGRDKECKIWLKKRGGDWIFDGAPTDSNDDAGGADETYNVDKFGCLYAVDAPGILNDFIVEIQKQARKYEAITMLCNFNENVSINGKKSSITCDWHAQITVFFDKKGTMSIPKEDNCIGAGHISLTPIKK